MPTYKVLSQKNPAWDGPYWRRCRALYAGGKKLLGDKQVMEDVFPKHLAERLGVYEERCKRAYYIPYAGEIVDMITSALFSEDLAMQGEPEPDPWYEEWAKDVSPPGGQRQSLQQFLKEQVTTALVCRQAWSLVDLPSMETFEDYEEPKSLAEQEQRGLLNAYACSLDPECVWDWECARDGRLLWTLVHYQFQKRDGIEGNRDMITEQWMYYTPDSWQRYEITYHKNNKPMDATEVPLVSEGKHSFGQVPIVRFELPDGLWAMGKVEPIAVAHLNKRNALSWAEYKSLFPVMAHFAQAPDPLNPASDDPDRAVNQTHGQGYVLQMSEKDRLEYIGADAGPFAMASQDLKDLRDEMHRVVHQMAMSVDNSAAALQRSADSKQVDQSATAIILREFGKLVREHSIELFEMVQAGRMDAKKVVWSASGMDAYGDTTVDQVVAQAQILESVSIPSATFQQNYKLQVARKVLGDVVDETVIEDIKKELEGNITNEQYQQPSPMDEFQAQQDQAHAELQVKAGGKPPKPKVKKKPSPDELS